MVCSYKHLKKQPNLTYLQHFQPQPVNSLFSPHIPPFLPVFTPYIPKHAPCRTFVRLRHSSYEPSSPLFSSFPKAPKKHLFRSQFSNAFISTVFYRAKIDPVCFYFAKIEFCNRILCPRIIFISLLGRISATKHRLTCCHSPLTQRH